jgi:predicted GNAT family acetyltransferase
MPEQKPKVEIRDNPDEARYELLEGDALVGFTQYRPADGRITLLHTEVKEPYSGRGLGGELARGALDDARRRGLAVVPECPFIAAAVRRDPDRYLELVVPALRKQVMTDDRSDEATGP